MERIRRNKRGAWSDDLIHGISCQTRWTNAYSSCRLSHDSFPTGTVFTTLKRAHPSFTYTVLVRNPAHFPAVISAGATPVLGALDDAPLIASLVEEADVVITCKNADIIEYHWAILDGMKRRKDSGRSVGVWLHTSGVAVFLDERKEGKFVEGAKVWNVGDI